MSLTFIGPSGTIERRWIVYAMLRDNVQHHLEGGRPSGEFDALHGMADALLYGETTVSAATLSNEMSRLLPLLEKPISELAVSNRTQAVQHFAFPLPQNLETCLAAQIEWRPTYPLQGASTLGDVIGNIVAELQRITAQAGLDDVVKVIDS